MDSEKKSAASKDTAESKVTQILVEQLNMLSDKSKSEQNVKELCRLTSAMCSVSNQLFQYLEY